MGVCNTYSYRIVSQDLDLTHRCSLSSMTNYILSAAGQDAERRGFGVTHIQKDNYGWVLSRMAVEIDRQPGQEEQMDVRTWVETVSRMMTTRNFILFDGDGNQIGRASTLWAMIDMTTRQPVDLSINTAYANAMHDEPAPLARPAKVRALTTPAIEQRTVRYSDIDFNLHTNTLRYLNWMLDLMPLETVTKRKFRRMDINFLHESRYGDVLDMHCEEVADGTCRLEIRNAEGTPVCRAEISFE